MCKVALTIAVIVLSSASSFAADLPLGAAADPVVQRVTQAMADHDDKAVLAALAELKALASDLPVSMDLVEANAAYNTGDDNRASIAIQAYLNLAPTDGPQYSDARALSSKIDKRLQANKASASAAQIVAQMRDVPAGDFVMGSNYCRKGDAGRKPFCGVYHAGSNDIYGRYDWHADPAHRVHVKAFRLANATVTAEQYNDFATATGKSACRKKEGDCFDYASAIEFCKWLSAASGQSFRLPSEAEWEYAATAGRPAAFANGDCRIDEPSGNCIFPDAAPNAFGIGIGGPTGVLTLELTADCWHDSFAGAPLDGSAWDADRCRSGRRVVKGSIIYRTSFAHRLASNSLPSDRAEDTQDRPANSLFTVRVAQSK